MTFVELGAAFAMGAMGSTHCVAMCGPLSTVLGSGPKRAAVEPGEASREAVPSRRRLPVVDAPRADWRSRGAAQAGRITTYAGLGAIAGTVGTGVRHLPGLPSVQLGVRVAAAVLLVGTGLYVAGVFKRFAWLEGALSPVHHGVSRLLRRARATGIGGRFVAGLTWGLLPCGLVLAALGLAVVAATPIAGATSMLAFGLGTLPALFAVDLFTSTFQRAIRQAWLRRAGGALIAISGVVQASLAVQAAYAARQPPCPYCASARHEGASP